MLVTANLTRLGNLQVANQYIVMEGNLILSAYAELAQNKSDLALELLMERVRFAFEIVCDKDGILSPNVTAVYMPSVSLVYSSFVDVNTDFLREVFNTLGQMDA